ncbi:MAG: stage III sporulation protein AA [Tyzzerella sp.]|nr:stage III sporulation protein AA [Tyzzerella sp.]
MRCENIKQILTRNIQEAIEKAHLDWSQLQEIRLRIGQPVVAVYKSEEIILPISIERKELMEIIEYVSNYSLYAYENELRQGFITIEGGHRVGMAGQVLVANGQVKNLKNISSVNIRISHEILHCADSILPYIVQNKQVCHTLIISPPRCGKTTILRDLVRQISDGNKLLKGCSVGVVDERSELAGCYQGIPQNNVGMRTDVLDGCPKVEGMLMLIRSMSPQVIAVDEIGGMEEVETMKYAMHCGVKMLVTVHGESMEEIRKKPLFEQLVKEHCFKRYIVLHNGEHVGEVAGIYDERGSLIYKEVKSCKS